MFIKVKRGRAAIIPPNNKIIPLIKASEIEVWIEAWIFPSSFLPMYFATITLVPIESPAKKFTNKLIAEPLLPTAAIAWGLANLPTTATSAELNNCWSIILAAKGSAKIKILSNNDPWSISIWCCLECCIIKNIFSSWNWNLRDYNTVGNYFFVTIIWKFWKGV